MKSKKPKKSAKNHQAPTPRRSTNGVGFEFEDQISAWLMVKMLAGEQVLPAIKGDGIQVQAQVSPLGWHIDDILLTTQSSRGERRRLAISAKGNPQVTSSGLPADFVTLAWKQWHDPDTPMNKSCDGLALAIRGNHSQFDATWEEIKNACSDSDINAAVKRIRGNAKQSKVFDSVQKLDKEELPVSDEETIELIRHLHVLPFDLQLAHSRDETQMIAQCRQLLVSGDAVEAKSLSEKLIGVARDVRLRSGTITLEELWVILRKQFVLHHHPDYACDWTTLVNITSDYKARIETKLSSGYSIPRTEEKSKLGAVISVNMVTMVLGESGTGKSALVKDVLDAQFGGWTQVWFGPDELKKALSAASRDSLPLRHELAQVLNATTKSNNTLVIDSAERIDPAEHGVIQRLLQTILPNAGQDNDSAWHVIFITQPQNGDEASIAISNGNQASLVEHGSLDISDVKLALSELPSLSWLAGHNDTISALTNLRTLAWVVNAESAFGSSPGIQPHTFIADRLWDYWTDGRSDLQRLMMNLAKREASFFERSFAITDLDSADATTLTPWPVRLPLYQNCRSNRIEFEHDLAADWARFQYLRQIWSDTAQWAALAENPLWTNALRMLGQYLLRETEAHKTAWDAALEFAANAKLDQAVNILLDALCLDPEAEQFLVERIDLLLSNNARYFNKLLNRFYHIGTVPTGGTDNTASLHNLYTEMQFRSVVIGRWPPVLRFLISQREKLSDLVSSALAQIIHTWLTELPCKFEKGTRVPFRRELAEMALVMARTVQVKNGGGAIYTATLAGAPDLPDKIGNWALELAGRREVDNEVLLRITEICRQQDEQHMERLQTDLIYKARHETRRKVPPVTGLGSEKLPPWPLGARRKVGRGFRDACIKKNGIKPLMQACPDVAAEVLLALIIEDQPERKYGPSRHEIRLGLNFAQDGYPTAFWKSPFFLFFQIAPDVAFSTLIALVNFCTERWSEEFMNGREGPVPGLTLQLAESEKKIFTGGYQVFNWAQSNSNHNGNLFSALNALERWLILQLDAGVDIMAYIERILREGTSAAFIGLLVNIGKYSPSLFSSGLAPVLTDPYVYFEDIRRIERVEQSFFDWHWAQAGEEMFEFAKNWTLAPHRQKTLLSVVVELLCVDEAVAKRFQGLISGWMLPENQKNSLEFNVLFARLDRNNYRAITDSETGNDVLTFGCPGDIKAELQLWEDGNEKSLQYLQLLEHCKRLLQARQTVSDEDAVRLYSFLKECDAKMAEAEATEDENNRLRCRIAIAATLIVLADSWLSRTQEAKKSTLFITRATLGEVTSASEGIRSRRRPGYCDDKLMFAACAVMHLWVTNQVPLPEWEESVLKLLTSGDANAVGTIMSIAYRHRQRSGSAWWRLLQVGLLWSGLITLAPHYREDKSAERIWSVWLTRLRCFQLKGKNASVNDLAIERIATGCERLDFYRRLRAFESGKKQWQGKPKRRAGMGLANDQLGIFFHWLIKEDGTGHWSEDAKLVRALWAYEVKRARECAKDADGEYDLPSQPLGYSLLQKLAELTPGAPETGVCQTEARTLWEPVLSHGPQAHDAIEHFISCLFQCLLKGCATGAFERVWQEIIEYGLAAEWDKPGLWFYGEQLICDLLGFGNEDALLQLRPGAALRMCDVYESWVNIHLKRDKKCTTRFCYFLSTEFGAPLRLDGLSWIANMLKVENPSDYWYSATTNALIELANTSLNQNACALINESQARQALIEIIAALVARDTPGALSLQEQITRLR